MLIAGKEINDECTLCGEMFQCELFKQGHAIRCERENVAELVKCQMNHKKERSE